MWIIEQLIQTSQQWNILRPAGLIGPGRHPGYFFKTVDGLLTHKLLLT